MSRLSDDILNMYLDNDLDAETRRKVSNQIEFSEEDRKRYLELQALHSGLSKMKPFEVSAEFTSLFMSKLLKAKKAKKEQKIFILSISSVFVLLCLIIVGFSFAVFLSSPGESSSSTFVNGILSHIGSFADSLSKNLNNQSLSIVGSIISFGVIISAYFFFENLKHSKESLNKF